MNSLLGIHVNYSVSREVECNKTVYTLLLSGLLFKRYGIKFQKDLCGTYVGNEAPKWINSHKVIKVN